VQVTANSLELFTASYVLLGGIGFYAGYPQLYFPGSFRTRAPLLLLLPLAPRPAPSQWQASLPDAMVP
jgi:hypothetical protein